MVSSVFGLMLQVIMLIFVFGSIVDGAEIPKPQYAVIFDAGSSGTKVLAYEFLSTYPDGKLVLNKEIFDKDKPGLAAYNKAPAKAAESISKLLEKAKSFVPEEVRSTTPLVLKATAGLRMLPSVEADNLLNAVREVLLRSGFLVKDNAVEIMGGADEGLFSWFTVNILMGRLDNLSFGENTVAALDMGGGSTQVSFASKDPNATPSLIKYIRKISTDKNTANVFSTSYERMGLDAARAGIVESGQAIDETGENFVSECVNPKIKSANFEFASKNYHVTGKNNSLSTEESPVVDYNVCAKLIKEKLMPLVKPTPITLNQKEIAAFSGFYWRTMLSGLVPEAGGAATIGQLVEKNKQVCATLNEKTPFECLDFTYLTELLMEGYGLDKDTKIDFYKQYAGHEISWTLGCAYNLLSGISWNNLD